MSDEGINDREIELEHDDQVAGQNELYSLLEASELSAAPLDANLRELSTLHDLEDHAELGEAGFRNGAGLLGPQQISDVYKDVYRSVTAMDFGAQHRMGLEGAQHLDLPLGASPMDHLESSMHHLSMQKESSEHCLREPSVRVFDHIRLEASHVYVACPFAEFVPLFTKLLRKHGVDCAFYEADCVWRGMLYPPPPAEAVNLRVHVNACPSVGNNRFVVEFIRRNGCGMSFHQLFAQVCDDLIRKNLVTRANGDFVSDPAELDLVDNAVTCLSNKQVAQDLADDDDEAALGFFPIKPTLSRGSSITVSSEHLTDFDGFEDDDDDDSFATNCTDEDLFRPLIDMCKSHFEDIHMQGLALVAHEVAKGNCQRMTSVAPDLVPLLCERLLESTHPEVRRNCLLALAGCAKGGAATADALCEHDAVLKALAEIAASEFAPASAELQRQAASTLANLCTSHAGGVGKVWEAVREFETSFQALEACDDARLVECIATVKNALAASQ